MKNIFDLDNIDVLRLTKDEMAFREFVYTPQSEAIEIIRKRRIDNLLKEAVNSFIGNIPSPFVSGIKAVLFRQVFTPNYEFRRFMKLASDMKLTPVFLEYFDDIFTSANPIKHCLGRMKFHHVDDNSRVRIRAKNVIDFNQSQGKKMKDVKTLWGQSLIDFHHHLLECDFQGSSKYYFDASEWFHALGGRAKNYYAKYISIYDCNAICFENFILEKDELKFIQEIFLPCFIESWKATGSKPIIVPLLPFDTENDNYWMSYPHKLEGALGEKK